MKICEKCGRIVYGNETCCGRLLTREEHIELIRKQHPNAFLDFVTRNYDRVEDDEIEEWFRKRGL